MIRLRLGILLANQSRATSKIFEPSDIASVQAPTLSPRTRRSIRTFTSSVRAASILPMILRRRQKTLRLQPFAKPQHRVGQVPIAINGQGKPLLSGQPLAGVGAVVDPDIDDLPPAKVVDAYPNFLFGVFLKLSDELA